MKVTSSGEHSPLHNGAKQDGGAGVTPLSLESASNLLDSHIGGKSRVLRGPDNQPYSGI